MSDTTKPSGPLDIANQVVQQIATDAAGVPLPDDQQPVPTPTDDQFIESLSEDEQSFAAAMQDRMGIEPELADDPSTTDDGTAPPIESTNPDPDLDDTDPPANPGESTDLPPAETLVGDAVAAFDAVKLGTLEFASPEEVEAAEGALRYLQSLSPEALQRMQDAASGNFGLVPLDPNTGMPVQSIQSQPVPDTTQDPNADLPPAIAALADSDPEIVAAFREQQAQIDAIQADNIQRANVEQEAALARSQQVLDGVRQSFIESGVLTLAECQRVEDAVARSQGLLDSILAANGGDLETGFKAAYEEGMLRVPEIKERVIQGEAERIASARVAQDATILRGNIDKKTRASAATSSSGSIVTQAVDLASLSPTERKQFFKNGMVDAIGALRRG